MQRLSFSLFVDAVRDREAAQYSILAALKEIHQHFRQNCIYPDLTDVIDIHQQTLDIFKQAKQVDSALPRTLSGIDLRNLTLLYSLQNSPDAAIQSIKELLEWSLPHIETTLEEGKIIYDFVDENCHVVPVGIIPTYQDEGYFIVPDTPNLLYAIVRYQVTVFTGTEDKYRALRTRLVDVIHMNGLVSDFRSLKLDLMKKFPELPNPAVYLCETAIEFPFAETLFPIAKRKLLCSIANNTIH